ncbi:MAG: hypothetical protein V3T00_04865, partial [bacterium]
AGVEGGAGHDDVGIDPFQVGLDFGERLVRAVVEGVVAADDGAGDGGRAAQELLEALPGPMGPSAAVTPASAWSSPPIPPKNWLR